jgi:hypothetical protein
MRNVLTNENMNLLSHLRLLPARRHIVEAAFVLTLAAMMAWNLWTYLPINWEFLSTKHYFEQRYYGGYSRVVHVDDGQLVAFQLESFPCLVHTRSFLDPQGRYIQGYNIDRLFSCGFLPSLIARIGQAHLGLRISIQITNILLWLAAILLTYHVVRAWSDDRIAALAGALITAGYPVYTLLFTSLKTQHAGATLFLAWLYIDRTVWPNLSWTERFLLLASTFTATWLAAGGAYFILVYILLRCIYTAVTEKPKRRQQLFDFAAVLSTFIIAGITITLTMDYYQLKSFVSEYHFDQVIYESAKMVWAAIRGDDSSGMRFLNFPRFSYFTDVLPSFIASFVRANPVIVVVPLVAVLFLRPLRFLWFLIPPLFIVGHAPVVIGGGWDWYYGYSSAPAAHILIIATAISIGMLFRYWRPYGSFAAIIVLTAAIYLFNSNPAFNFDNFYWDSGTYPHWRHLYVYHDLDVVKYW